MVEVHFLKLKYDKWQILYIDMRVKFLPILPSIAIVNYGCFHMDIQQDEWIIIINWLVMCIFNRLIFITFLLFVEKNKRIASLAAVQSIRSLFGTQFKFGSIAEIICKYSD